MRSMPRKTWAAFFAMNGTPHRDPRRRRRSGDLDPASAVLPACFIGRAVSMRGAVERRPRAMMSQAIGRREESLCRRRQPGVALDPEVGGRARAQRPHDDDRDRDERENDGQRAYGDGLLWKSTGAAAGAGCARPSRRPSPGIVAPSRSNRGSVDPPCTRRAGDVTVEWRRTIRCRSDIAAVSLVGAVVRSCGAWARRAVDRLAMSTVRSR